MWNGVVGFRHGSASAGARGLAGALVLGAVPLLAGCGADDAPRACTYAVCSIQDRACVDRTAEVVGCKLGQPTLRPEVRFLTAAQVLAEDQAAAPPPTAQELADEADYLRVDALIGLMPEGYLPEAVDAQQLRNFVAFYTHDTKGIVVVTDHVGADAEQSYLVLVHELVHAYQDARWDLASLDATYGATYDRFLGLRALLEGHAVLHQNLAYLGMQGIPPAAADWARYFADWQQQSLEAAQATETPDLDTLAFFPYAFGGEVVVDGWLARGAAGVDALYGDPPDSVRQVMGGHAAWPDDLANADAALDPQAIAVLPDAYQIFGGGHESVWALNAMLQRTAGGGLWAAELGAVSADYLTALRWHDTEVVAMWRVHTDRPADLVDALTTPAGTAWVVDAEGGAPTTHVVTTLGSDVLLIAVSSGDARDVLHDIAGWQSVEEASPDDPAGSTRRSVGPRLGPGFRARDPRRYGLLATPAASAPRSRPYQYTY